MPSIMNIPPHKNSEEDRSCDGINHKGNMEPLLDNLPCAVYQYTYSYEEGWQTKMISAGIESLTGFTKEELMNFALYSEAVVYPDDKKIAWLQINQLLKRKRSFKVSYRIITKSGELKWVLDNGRGVYDERGELLLIEGILTDITYQKLIEEELQINNEQLEAQKDVLEKTLAWLKKSQAQLVQAEKMSSLGVLVAGVAHEINNPVNFIYAGSDVLVGLIDELTEVNEQLVKLYEVASFEEFEQLKEEMSSVEPEEIEDLYEDCRKIVHDIKNGADRTAEIVKNLKTFSRTEPDVMKPSNLHDGLDSILVLLNNVLAGRVRIMKDYDRRIELIRCLPNQLNQVFMNLIKNASDAIEGTGEILIQTRKKEESVEILIQDSGEGINPEIQEQIFNPFFTTKAIGKGTGLGLAISYEIIEKHKGSIKIESEVGKGSKFIIRIPDNG